MNDPAAILVERAKSGDFAAASELLTQSYEYFFAYFRRLCGNAEDAADLTQKTFCKVWGALARYDARSTFKTWVHAIAHHVYVDWRRERRPAESQTDCWWDEQAGTTPTPADSAADRDAATRVYSAVERLDDDHRETVHLHYFQGLTIEQTAETMNVATSTVKYRLRKALDLLQSQLIELKIPA